MSNLESSEIVDAVLTDNIKLSLTATLECGQCFRWQNANNNLQKHKNTNAELSDDIKGDVSYYGIVCGMPVRVWESGSGGEVRVKGRGTIEFWRDYFDLDRDYDLILSQFGTHPFTLAAINFGRGLRVLRQDAWEMLFSYIISQNNNIPRISSSIAQICRAKGEPIDFDGRRFYSFPLPEAAVKFSELELRQAGLGYRVEYLMAATRAVLDGKLNFVELKKMPTEDARQKLLELRGVGSKVANCVLLFGLGKMDAFPIDTWIAKSAKYYDGNLDGTRFGEFAGIAQEYIFHYIRQTEKNITKPKTHK
jgi:N-glycosylase/DNA lyase